MTAKGITSRKLAHNLLMRVFRQKQTLEQAMAAEAKALSALEGPDRGFVYYLAMAVLRYHGACEQLLAEYLQQPIRDNRLDIRLCLYLGICQLMVLKSPAHAVVDTSVELAKIHYKPLAGLVNAVLKKIAGSGGAWWQRHDLGRLNTPEWLWESWVKAYGLDRANAIAKAHCNEPPLDISLKNIVAIERWSEILEARRLPTDSLRLEEGGGDITSLPGFAEGEWWVQELAASLPVKLMGEMAGKKVLDLCAAPGGKTAQLLATGAEVTAVDISAARLKRLEENLQRLGMHAEIVEADISKWEPQQRYDAILLDAPCSSTGTIRRNPEIMILRQPQDVARLVEIQHRMLRRVLPWLKPGGILIYAVCSLQAEESEEQIAALLAENRATIMPITAQEVQQMQEWITPQGSLRTLPCHLNDSGGMDGFFLARLSIAK